MRALSSNMPLLLVPLCLCFFSLSIQSSYGFAPSTSSSTSTISTFSSIISTNIGSTRFTKHKRQQYLLYASKSADEEEEQSVIPCLPPIGESSFKGDAATIETSTGTMEVNKSIRVSSDKFELQYTCNICETRNTHKVSRMGKND